MRGHQLERVTIETEHVTVLATQLLLTVVHDRIVSTLLMLLLLLKRSNKALRFLSNVSRCWLLMTSSMTLRVSIFFLLIRLQDVVHRSIEIDARRTVSF